MSESKAGTLYCECSNKCEEVAACRTRYECGNERDTTLYRIDMEDRDGTYMCSGCATDAMDSGLFTERR